MDKEQAVTYLRFSGFSDEQIKAIEGAFTCEDAISRQAVLSKIKEVCFSEEWEQFRVDNGSNGQRDFLINYIEQLSSVSSSEKPNKSGQWIERVERDDWDDYEEVWYECDQCHVGSERVSNYCPACGAKMSEGSEKV